MADRARPVLLLVLLLAVAAAANVDMPSKYGSSSHAGPKLVVAIQSNQIQKDDAQLTLTSDEGRVQTILDSRGDTFSCLIPKRSQRRGMGSNDGGSEELHDEGLHGASPDPVHEGDDQLDEPTDSDSYVDYLNDYEDEEGEPLNPVRLLENLATQCFYRQEVRTMGALRA